MTWLLKIIYRCCCEQFCVATFFCPYHYTEAVMYVHLPSQEGCHWCLASCPVLIWKCEKNSYLASLSCHIAGRSQGVPGADWTRVVEQPARGAAAAAAPADTERPQRERPRRAGSVLHPNRRPRCQLVNHQRASLLGIYTHKKKKKRKKHREKKNPSISVKAEKKNKRTKNVKNTSPLKEKEQCLLVFL